MQHSELQGIAARLNAVGTDLTKFMALIGSMSGEWVEMRHTPANPELDGYRPRDDFVAYLMREADFFPRTFDAVTVNASTRVEGDHIAIEPLSFSGTLPGSGRQVDIRYRLTLHFDAGRVWKITGALTRDNNRDDVIAWLKVIESLGGLGQTLALAEKPLA